MKTLAIVTICDGEADLLPFWLKHYESIGVDHLLVCVDRNTIDDFQPVLKHLMDSDATIHEYWLDGGGVVRDEQEREAVTREASVVMPDWILWTDLDEHQEYAGGMQAALAKAEATGDNIVVGQFCDRVAADGSMAPLPDLAIFLGNIYPLETRITRDLIRTRYVKVMAAKPGVVLLEGRHGTTERRRPAKRLGVLDEGHLVHHFKWRAGILERIRHKMATLESPKYDWYRACYQPFLDIVEANGGKFPLEHLK